MTAVRELSGLPHPAHPAQSNTFRHSTIPFPFRVKELHSRFRVPDRRIRRLRYIHEEPGLDAGQSPQEPRRSKRTRQAAQDPNGDYLPTQEQGARQGRSRSRGRQGRSKSRGRPGRSPIRPSKVEPTTGYELVDEVPGHISQLRGFSDHLRLASEAPESMVRYQQLAKTKVDRKRDFVVSFMLIHF